MVVGSGVQIERIVIRLLRRPAYDDAVHLPYLSSNVCKNRLTSWLRVIFSIPPQFRVLGAVASLQNLVCSFMVALISEVSCVLRVSTLQSIKDA